MTWSRRVGSVIGATAVAVGFLSAPSAEAAITRYKTIYECENPGSAPHLVGERENGPNCLLLTYNDNTLCVTVNDTDPGFAAVYATIYSLKIYPARRCKGTAHILPPDSDYYLLKTYSFTKA